MTPHEFYALRGSPFGYSDEYDGFHTGQATSAVTSGLCLAEIPGFIPAT